MFKTQLFRKHIPALLALFLTIPVFYSCKTQQHYMTEPLFMQYKRVHLIPPADEEDGQKVLAETVVILQRQDTTGNAAATLGKLVRYDDRAKLDTSATYTLNEVTVSSKAHFRPERHGKVNVDFVIHVPKELLSENWNVSMTPYIQLGDSLLPLEPINVKGRQFYAHQLKNRLEYQDYLNTIVDEDDYEKVFLDKEGISEDMRKRQSLYRNLYKSDWEKMNRYKKWYHSQMQNNERFNKTQEAKEATLYNRLQSEAKYEKVKNAVMGKDTAGISKKYLERFEKEAKPFRVRRTITLKDVPKEFHEYYLENLDFNNLQGRAVSDRDSAEIARNKLQYDKIAENEAKKANKELMRMKLLPEIHHVYTRLDTVIDHPNADFIYHYQQEIPVPGGLKKAGIFLNGQVYAIDRSTYTLAATDTLSYFITSMSQLVDTSLITKRTTIYRDMFSKMSLYPAFNGGAAFNVKTANNHLAVDTLVNTFRTFTDKGLSVDSIQLEMKTDLSGNFDKNYELSVKRAGSFAAWLSEQEGMPSSVFRPTGKGEDWVGFLELLKNSTQLSSPEELMQVILATTFPDDTKKMLQKYYSSDYEVMKKEIFPLLNRLDVTFHISRPGMTVKDSVRLEYREEYAEGIRLMNAGRYWDALQILSNYSDYNTALCMSLLGYDPRAFNLLQQLEQTARVQYLSSIILWRMNRRDEAAALLLEALQQDGNLIYRAEQDAETKALLGAYRIRQKLAGR